ncbi:MAG TPA: ribokinase, partial [Rhodospirillaceae bacterium]|nr:ribokinase [Rhodospirillaceae bacterium]
GALLNAFDKGEISPEQLTELNRHIEKMQELESTERQNAIEQINESLRAEVASTDPYVRRMRPTFGYIIALTWAAQMFSIAYVMVFDTKQAVLVINAVESLGSIWGIGLS